MKVYIWQNTPNTKWHIYYDFDHPLGRQLKGTTTDLFKRTTLIGESMEKTATFRLNPQTSCGELFTDMTFYQFLLEPDLRTGDKEQCILQSTGRWLVQHPKLDGVKFL